MGLFSKEEEYKLVIVMRSDLKMSKGKIAAQASHAAVNCAFACKKKDPKGFDKWYSDGGQKKVVLKVNSLDEIYELKAVADAQGITNTVIIDQGRTEIPTGSVTCIGIGPGPDSVIDKITGGLSML
jgi:peptidyl-tRNA hydrolase, PTH2 family